MNERHDVCLETGVGNWVLLIKFFPDGGIKDIVETLDNPGVRVRSLEDFMASNKLGQDDKDSVQKRINRLEAKYQDVKPPKKVFLEIQVFKRFTIPASVLRIKQTKK